MFRHLLSALALALAFPLSAYSQQESAPVASVRPSDPDWKSVLVSALDGQLIGVKQANKSYYFTPTPVVDWAGFAASVTNACANYGDAERRPAELNLLYYHSLILTEIAQKAGIDLNKLSVVPHFGHSVFLRDMEQNSHMIATDVDLSTLLQGEAMAINRPLPATERIIVNQPCALLKDFAFNRSLIVSYHAKGSKFETASINAEVLLSSVVDTFFDTSDAQEQVDKTTIKVSSGGSGLAIDVGPLSYNSAQADNKVVTSTERYRAINRNWLSERAENAIQTTRIEEVCSRQKGCLEDNLPMLIINFALQGAEEQRLDFRERADKEFDILLGQRNVGKAILNIDETVKATLNTIFANSSDEEQSGEFAGFKYKRKDDNTLTINGNSEFTKRGERWIPTSLTLDLVDTSKVQNRIRAGYARTVLQDKVFVSYRAQNAPMEKLPEGFIQGDFYDIHKKTVDDLAAARKASPFARIVYFGFKSPSIKKWGDTISNGCGMKKRYAGRLDVFMKEKCGANHRVISYNRFLNQPGGSCGQNYYLLVCMSK